MEGACQGDISKNLFVKTVFIFPWARRCKNGDPCPKDYPFWREVVVALRLKSVITVQVSGIGEDDIGADMKRENLSLEELIGLLGKADTFISVDSFAPHLANFYGKHGIVIFSQSDPTIFGYEQNINLLKDRKYLRPNQFEYWDQTITVKEAFVDPIVVVESVIKKINEPNSLRGR